MCHEEVDRLADRPHDVCPSTVGRSSTKVVPDQRANLKPWRSDCIQEGVEEGWLKKDPPSKRYRGRKYY